MNEILSWNQVSFAYGNMFEVRDVSYTLREGDFTLFFGPNGAGKTTLFKIGTGLLTPQRGCVYLEGKNIAEYPITRIARRVAYLEQDIQYLFPFTVEEVVLMGRFAHTSDQFWDRKQDFEIAVQAMEMTGTLRFAKRSMFQLSGGEKRKVEVARAICQEPRLLFLDEPTTFLDVRQQVELFELLSRLNREKGITVAVISHQLALAKGYVREGVCLKGGGILEAGPPEVILAEDNIRRFFELAG